MPRFSATDFASQPARRPLSALMLAGLVALVIPTAHAEPPTRTLEARIVAVGIPGASGVRQIGRFHAGGPVPGNPEFLMQTRPGRMLDPERVMVTSRSNFGAPTASPELAPGSVLSIAVGLSKPLVIPPLFAAKGGQSIAAEGAIQLFTAQSGAFTNRIHNRGAQTAELPAAAGPRSAGPRPSRARLPRACSAGRSGGPARPPG